MSEPAPEPPAPPPAPSAWARARAWTAAWLARNGTYPLKLFLLTRAGYMAASYVGLSLVPGLWYHPEARQKFLEPYPLIDGLCRWDCGWFVHIYRDGYINAEYAKVFPLLPALGWFFEKTLGVHHLITFLVVPNLCALAAYYVLYRMFRELNGEEAARWGLAAFVAYPFAYYQAAAYPESLMLLASALGIWLAMKGRHIWAGVAVGLGTMARHLTIFAGAGLVAAQVRQRGLHPRKLLLHPAVLGLVVPWLFVGAFAWHLQVKVGDPLAFWNSRTIGWGPVVWYGVHDVIKHATFADRPEWFLYMGFALWPLAGTIALLTRKQWIELAAFGAVLMYVLLTGGAVALGRYSASVWPAFLPLGVWLAKRPNWQIPVLVTSALLQGLFFFLYSHQWRIL